METNQHRFQSSTQLHWAKFLVRQNYLQICKFPNVQLGYNRTLSRDVPINRYY